MTQADERILETLAESNMILSPHIIAVNADYTRNYMTKRLSILREHDLVDRVDDGLYTITELGRAYLSGEVEASVLEPDG
jgi:repressor of nif and glnA expression